MKTPNSILECLCARFNVGYKHFYDEKKLEKSIEKRRDIRSLYQIMFYGVNNGKKKMPFHMLVAEMVFNSWICRTLVTALNHWRSVLISYYGAVITWLHLC